MSSMPVGFLGGKQSVIRLTDANLLEDIPEVGNFLIKAEILGPWRIHRSTSSIGGNCYRLQPMAPVVVQDLLSDHSWGGATIAAHGIVDDGSWPGLCFHYLQSTSIVLMFGFYRAELVASTHVEGFIYDDYVGFDIANGLYGDYPSLVPGTFTISHPDGEAPGTTMGIHFGGSGIVPLDGLVMDLVAGDISAWVGQF